MTFYDPGLAKTAVTKSSICQIVGETSELRIRGYDIAELAEKATVPEVAFLILHGALPDEAELTLFSSNIARHAHLHTNLHTHMAHFRYDAHPMGMFISTMSALATYYPESNPALVPNGQTLFKERPELVNKAIYRVLGKVPTIVAAVYRARQGRAPVSPPAGGSFESSLAHMLWARGTPGAPETPLPGSFAAAIERALRVMTIVHMEHGLNASTFVMRAIGSAGTDPITAIAGAAAALYGPAHGGANEAALRQLREIGTVDAIPAFLAEVRAGRRRLAGFGHRVYKSMDPRALIVKQVAEDLFESLGETPPLFAVAVALERAALADPFFINKRIFPNVDFYSGLVYDALNFPPDFFPVLFAMSRSIGWLAHWKESLHSPDDRLFRPKAIYTGAQKEQFIPIEQRTDGTGVSLVAFSTMAASKL
jgi:citrate synthase